MDRPWEPPPPDVVPPPLFRSFFAAEVRELLRGRDVSTIEAEPPPASPSPAPRARPGPRSLQAPVAPAPDLTFVLLRAGLEPPAPAPGPRTPPGSPWTLPGPGELEHSAGAAPDESSSCLSLCSGSFLTSTPLTPPARITFARAPALAPRSLLAAGHEPGHPCGSTTFLLDAAPRSLLTGNPGPADPHGTAASLDAAPRSLLTGNPGPADPHGTAASLDAAPHSLLTGNPEPGNPSGSTAAGLDVARCSLLVDDPEPRDLRSSTTAVPGTAQGSLLGDNLELRDLHGSTTFFLDAAQCSLLGDDLELRDPHSFTTAVLGAARGSLLGTSRDPCSSTTAILGAAQDSPRRDPHGSTTAVLGVAQGSLLKNDLESRDQCGSTTAILGASRGSLLGMPRDPPGSITAILCAAQGKPLRDDPEPKDLCSSTTAILGGSPLGDDLEPRDAHGSTTAVPGTAQVSLLGADLEPRDLCSSTTTILGDPVSQSSVQPSPATSTHSTAVPEHLPAPPASPRPIPPRRKEPAGSNNTTKGTAPVRPRMVACSLPTAQQDLTPTSCSSRRAPKGRGCALAGQLSRVSLSNLRLSLQRPVGTRDVLLGSQTKVQPPAQVLASTTAKQSSAKLLSIGKCSTGLRPPSRLPGLGSSRAGPGGLQAPVGMELPGSSKGAGAPGTGLPPRPGSRRQLVKPGPGNLPLPSGAPQLLEATSSPQDKALGINTTYSASHVQAAAKAARSRLPPRRAVTGAGPATAVAPRSRLQPPAKASASPRSLPPCKRVRLGEGEAGGGSDWWRALYRILYTPGRPQLEAMPLLQRKATPQSRPVLTMSACAGTGAQGCGAQQEPALTDGSSGPVTAEASCSMGDAAQGPTCRDPVAVLCSSPNVAPRGMGAATPMQSPGNLVNRKLEQVQNELELARSELQRVQRELEGARTELVEKDTQCQAYRRAIADLQAQLEAAGSMVEGCRREA